MESKSQGTGSVRPLSSTKQKILQARQLDEEIERQEVRESAARRISEELIAKVISDVSKGADETGQPLDG